MKLFTVVSFIFGFFFSRLLSRFLMSLLNTVVEQGHGSYTTGNFIISEYFFISLFVKKYNGFILWVNFLSLMMPAFGPKPMLNSGFPLRKFIKTVSAQSSRLWPVVILSALSSLVFLFNSHLLITPQTAQLLRFFFS